MSKEKANEWASENWNKYIALANGCLATHDRLSTKLVKNLVGSFTACYKERDELVKANAELEKETKLLISQKQMLNDNNNKLCKRASKLEEALEQYKVLDKELGILKGVIGDL